MSIPETREGRFWSVRTYTHGIRDGFEGEILGGEGVWVCCVTGGVRCFLV